MCVFFIVFKICCILSSFKILPKLSNLFNFHRDTSLITLARSGNHGSRFASDYSDDGAANNPLVTREPISLIRSMSVNLSYLVLISSRILSVHSIVVCYLINLWRFFCIWTRV